MEDKKNTAGSEAAAGQFMERLQQLPKAIWPRIWWDILHERLPEELGEETEFVDWREYRYWLGERISETVGIKACARYYNTLSEDGHPAYFDDQMFDDFWDSRMEKLQYQILEEVKTIPQRLGEEGSGKTGKYCNRPFMTALISFFIGCLGGIVGFLLTQLLQLL